MAWFPCNIGGGSPEPTPVPVSMKVKTTSVDGYTASVELSTYEDSQNVLYSTVMGESNAEIFGAVKLYYDSAWYLKAIITCEYDGNTYDEGDLIRTWSYAVEVDMKIYYTEPARGNATMKQGTFVSATSQFGIVDVDCGFKPDLVMVKLPLTGGDTVSYWEKGMSWAETKACWGLAPAENNCYAVNLGRTTGETGIQAINNNGFSFMSNGGNTRGITCEYIAVKYEVPQPQIANTVIENAQVSDKAGETYVYPTYSDISNYDCVVIKIYTTVSDVYYENYVVADCDRLPLAFSSLILYDANGNAWNRSFAITVGNTSITQVSYSDSWEDVYIDIIGINHNIGTQ